MILYADEARRQIDTLTAFYERKERPEASRRLNEALADAGARIVKQPLAGLAAPRPYPKIARPDRLWIKAGRYWISYTPTTPPVILNVFFERANIPGRV